MQSLQIPYVPRQIKQKIINMNKEDLHQLIIKDIYWMNKREGQRPKLSKQIQLEKCYLKVYYGAITYIDVLFPDNVSVHFGPQYFEQYSAIKFASLVYLLIDSFGPIRNPMAFQIQAVREQLGFYKQFNSKNVLRLSLKKDPVYITVSTMVKNFS